MPSEHHNFDPVELALRELAEAEQSRLFARTVIPDDSVQPVAPAFFLASPMARRWVKAVAAVVVLAVGVWTAMFTFQLGRLRERTQTLAGTDIAAPLLVVRSFTSCLAGPKGGAASGECVEQDRNADGHIDLRDFSALLLASADSPG